MYRVSLSALAVALLGTGVPSHAEAASTCAGTMQASLVHPLPAPLSVGANRRITDAANPELARRFADGLRKSGVALSETPNATLNIAVSVTPGAASNVRGGTYQGLEWMNGQTMTRNGGPQSLHSAKLSISAVLADNAAATQSWVATIDCTVGTDDAGELAEFMGNTIGHAIGQNMERRRI